MTELYIGLMSGTSMDGVDAALVDFSTATPNLIHNFYHPFSDEIKNQISALTMSGENEIHRLATLDASLANEFSFATNELLKASQLKPKDIQAIGSHGQTIRHAPNAETPFTLQISDPNTIASLTNITTVADFRRKDIALKGQGAPLTPVFHEAIFRSTDEDRIIVNIGGIANITVLPADPSKPIVGFDTGPGNTLLDAWAKKNIDRNYDEGGEWAATGNTDETLLSTMLADAYFKMSAPKSTGTDYFNLDWFAQFNTQLKPEAIQATLVALTAISIANSIPKESKVIVCGGGVHNHYLINTLEKFCGQKVFSSEEFGIEPDWVEAIAFAWLAKQTLTKKPINLCNITGSKRPAILGGIYYP